MDTLPELDNDSLEIEEKILYRTGSTVRTFTLSISNREVTKLIDFYVAKFNNNEKFYFVNPFNNQKYVVFFDAGFSIHGLFGKPLDSADIILLEGIKYRKSML